MHHGCPIRSNSLALATCYRFCFRCWVLAAHASRHVVNKLANVYLLEVTHSNMSTCTAAFLSGLFSDSRQCCYYVLSKSSLKFHIGTLSFLYSYPHLVLCCTKQGYIAGAVSIVSTMSRTSNEVQIFNALHETFNLNTFTSKAIKILILSNEHFDLKLTIEIQLNLRERAERNLRVARTLQVAKK